MRSLIGMTMVALALLTGCASGEKQAAELLETARFEEKQNNFEHAAQLYEEILRKHPSAAAAAEAAVRAEALRHRKRP